MIILMEALKGGMAELRDCPDFSARLSTAARHARLIAEELTGQVALIPFALRALSERRRAKREGRLVEGVRYGPRGRQVADLWLPRRSEEGERPPAIAVLFHGGTWTAGDKWHVGPAASHLAKRCRCVVVAPNYSVYSSREGLGISASVEDAVDAVRWAGTAAAAAAAVAETGGGGGGAAAVGEGAEARRGGSSSSSPSSAGRPPRPLPPPPPRRPPLFSAPASPPPSSSHGGDPTRLAVLGHSAGAHLAVSAALVLAAEREGGVSPSPHLSLVVSLAGPFDLPSHFEHEAKRGVHRLSTMARAAATPGSFALEASSKGAGAGAGAAAAAAAVAEEEEGGERSPSSAFFDAAPGLHRASLVALSPLACVAPERSLAGLRPAAGPLAGAAAAAARRARRGAAAGRRRGGGREEEEAEGGRGGGTTTRFLFLSSDADTVVPSSSSAALSAALARGRGGGLGVCCSARHVEYSAAGHADFVVRGWGLGGGGDRGSGGGGDAAAPWAAEVEAVVSSL